MTAKRYSKRQNPNKAQPVLISGVEEGSIAHECGLERGDRLVSMNGKILSDIFDYRMLSLSGNLFLIVQKANDGLLKVKIKKDEYDDLGIIFSDPLFNGIKRCTNKCIFCFIDQLPQGMRSTLYIKDDDSRLSFLSGNYITTTNMSNHDIRRIINYKMSPVNISVHSTDPELRGMMLGNRFSDDILERINKLSQGGIEVNCQLVLCKGINDGGRLDRTISDLAGKSRLVNSISIVPAGLTKYREGLYPLAPFDMNESSAVIRQVRKWQDILLERHGSRIVYASDEFYLDSRADLPEYREYEDFPQLENGVGMIALFKYEFDEACIRLLSDQQNHPDFKRNVSIATGTAAYGFIRGLVECVERSSQNITINVHQVKNEKFGSLITVSGLVCGCDILSQLSGMQLGQELLIPANMLKNGEDVFLDGISIEELSRGLDVRVTPVKSSGEAFLKSLLREAA